MTRPDYSGTRTTALFARLSIWTTHPSCASPPSQWRETLEAGSLAVEAAGHVLKTDVSAHWQADCTFFDLIRDKQAMQALLADIAGPEIASANAAEKQKVKKKIALDLAEGTNGRKKAEGWLPGWLQVPAEGRDRERRLRECRPMGPHQGRVRGLTGHRHRQSRAS